MQFGKIKKSCESLDKEESIRYYRIVKRCRERLPNISLRTERTSTRKLFAGNSRVFRFSLSILHRRQTTMSTVRKWHLLTLLILVLALALTACGGSSGGSSGPITIRFYGNVTEWASQPAMTKALQDHFKGKYNIQMINVDFGNLDTVIKTGLISGNP